MAIGHERQIQSDHSKVGLEAIGSFLSKQGLLTAFAVGLLALCGCGSLGVQEPEPAEGVAPLTLSEIGHFWMGGEVIESSLPAIPPDRYVPFAPSVGNTVVGASYVEYMVPANADPSLPPVIMVPGGELPATIYGTTPDGREGWYHYFVRKGHAVYLIEPPGRGRSGFPVDGLNAAILGGDGEPGPQMPQARRWTDFAWVTWRQGPQPGVHGANQMPCPHRDAQATENPAGCGGYQWPEGEDAYKQFMAMMPAASGGVPTGEFFPDAVTDLIQHLGGSAIVVSHSAGGAAMQQLANQRPDLFEALIAVEPAGFLFCGRLPEDLSGFSQVPYLHLIGDTQRPTSDRQDVCGPLMAASVAAGGTAELIQLPDLGIYGNGHIMMQELNSDEIADVMFDWLQGVGVRP